MKARIEKKLSERLIQLAPKMFKNAWIDKYETSELAQKQGTRVSNIYSVGGGVDYWGEGQDAYTAWEWLTLNWEWIGDFPSYPEGHKLEGYPDTSGFRPTTRNLLRYVAINAA
jgi:hypothetical protein